MDPPDKPEDDKRLCYCPTCSGNPLSLYDVRYTLCRDPFYILMLFPKDMRAGPVDHLGSLHHGL